MLGVELRSGAGLPMQGHILTQLGVYEVTVGLHVCHLQGPGDIPWDLHAPLLMIDSARHVWQQPASSFQFYISRITKEIPAGLHQSPHADLAILLYKALLQLTGTRNNVRMGKRDCWRIKRVSSKTCATRGKSSLSRKNTGIGIMDGDKYKQVLSRAAKKYSIQVHYRRA